jgi:hypothetical protein
MLKLMKEKSMPEEEYDKLYDEPMGATALSASLKEKPKPKKVPKAKDVKLSDKQLKELKKDLSLIKERVMNCLGNAKSDWLLEIKETAEKIEKDLKL